MDIPIVSLETNKMAIDRKLLEICERAIMYRLGGLGGIPSEVANTVANVYYRYFDTTWDREQKVETVVRLFELSEEEAEEEEEGEIHAEDNPCAMVRAHVDT